MLRSAQAFEFSFSSYTVNIYQGVLYVELGHNPVLCVLRFFQCFIASFAKGMIPKNHSALVIAANRKHLDDNYRSDSVSSSRK